MNRRISVLYPPERDLKAWAQRNQQFEVPGRWPYGLEELSRPPAVVQAGNLRTPTLSQAFAARAVPVRLRALRALSGEVGVTWDENAARLMVAADPRPEMYSGVIWLPDSVAADPHGRYRRIRSALRKMRKVWVLSRAQLQPLQQILGKGCPPVEFVKFGVDKQFFAAQPYPDRPLVLSIGGDRHRDPATLFRALQVVHERVPSAQIIVQSKSPLPPPPGVEKVAHVSHSELRELYARASVIAVATANNLHASGMTVGLEAMATGRPVVMTRTPGMEDYVNDGVSGFLTAPTDHLDLAAGVVRLLEQPDLGHRMGLAGRREVEDGMTTAHLARRLSELIDV
jgi:glycosyltransferase involved in cell wall biosynthesis